MNGLLSVRELRMLISRKAFERKEIADTQITTSSPLPFGAFKDPYIFHLKKNSKAYFFRLLSSFSIQNIPIFFKTIKVTNKMMMIIANGFPKLIVNPRP
ncbi:MAG: hypothetical protein FWC47_16265, partial [Oscillospiraceae bacterium]|nr:hypothetical protein [Oscillospiraceae bacterium]